MLAIWDIHDPTLDGYHTEISTGLGLPPWVESHRVRLARPRRPRSSGSSAGSTTASSACASITAGARRSTPNDPNGITVEFCASTREFTADDRAEAHALLAAAKPQLNETAARGRVLHRERVGAANGLRTQRPLRRAEGAPRRVRQRDRAAGRAGVPRRSAPSRATRTSRRR